MDLIVGDPDCPFMVVSKILMKVSTSGQLVTKLEDMAKELGVPVDIIKTNLLLGVTTSTEAIHEILVSWRAQCSSGATLSVLLDALENAKLSKIADDLRAHFAIETVNHKRFESASNFGILNDPSCRIQVVCTLDRKITEQKLRNTINSIHVTTEREFLSALLSDTSTNHALSCSTSSVKGLLWKMGSVSNIKCNVVLISEERVEDIKGLDQEMMSVIQDVIRWSELTSAYQRELSGRNVRLSGYHTTLNDVLKDFPLAAQLDLDSLLHGKILVEIINDKCPNLLRNTIPERIEYYVPRKATARSRVNKREAHEEQYSEDEFLDTLERLGEDNAGRHICLSDTPGMGKSVLLAELGRRLATRNRIVLFGIMWEMVAKLKHQMKTQPHFKSAVDTVISGMAGSVKLAQTLLRDALRSSPSTTYIDIMLDGFDEVSSGDLALAKEFLQILIRSFSVRLWVTTRPHLLEELEKSVNGLGYNIQPFSKDDQIKCLVQFWMQQNLTGEVVSVNVLETFAAKCLDTLHISMRSNKDGEIAGIPLQCMLIGEVYEDDAKKYANPENACNAETFELSVHINSIADLYERMIEKKLEKYERRYTFKTFNKEQLVNAHKQLALQLLFPDHVETFRENLTFEEEEDQLKDVLRVGMLSKSNDDDIPSFLHQTVAEFFVALLLAQLAGGSIKDVCSTKYSKFISHALESVKMAEGFHGDWYRFHHQVICYFLDSLIAPSNNYQIALSTDISKLAYSCAYGDLANLFNFVVDMVTSEREQRSMVFNKELLVVAARCSGLDLISRICDLYEEQGTKVRDTEIVVKFPEQDRQPTITTIFNLVLKYREYSIVEYFVNELGFEELLQQNHDNVKAALHNCVGNSMENESWLIADKVETLKLLCNYNGLLLEQKNGSGNTPLLQFGVHVDLLNELLAQGANVEMGAQEDPVLGNIAYVATIYLGPDDYHQLLLNLATRGHAHIFASKFHVLHSALYHMEPKHDTLELFKNQGVDFNQVDDYGDAALSVAISGGRSMSVLQSLVELGADWTTQNKKGCNVFHQTCEAMNYGALELFANLCKSTRNADMINAKNNKGRTPLHEVVASFKSIQSLEGMEALLKYGADVNAMDFFANNTALHYAIDKLENEECHVVVSVLLDYGADVTATNLKWCSPLDLALRRVQDKRTIELMEQRNTGNKNANSALHKAAQLGDLAAATLLIRDRYDVNGRTVGNRTPLHVVFAGDEPKTNLMEVIKLIIDNDGDLNAKDDDGRTPIHWAARLCKPEEDFVEVTKYLVKRGADLTAKDNMGQNIMHLYLPHCPTEAEFSKLVLWLAENSCAELLKHDVKSRRPSLLHLAVMTFELDEILLELLTAHVNINSLTVEGHSVLAYAVIGQRSSNFLQMLVDQGADLTWRSNDGSTLLHVAGCCGNVDATHFIVSKDCDIINAKNFDGSTPLLHSVNERNDNMYDVIRVLLYNNADVFARNSLGQTALDLTMEQHQQQGNVQDRTIELLKSKMLTFETSWEHYEHDTLHGAAQFENLASMKALVAKGFSVNRIIDGHTPLHRAFYGPPKEKLMEMVEFLIRHKAAVNARDEHGATPLHWAVEDGRSREWMEVIQYLVESGADVNAKDMEGKTIMLRNLTKRSSEEYHNLILWLKKSNALEKLLEMTDDFEHTPLHIAFRDIDLKEATLELLLQHNDINVVDQLRNNALFYAIGNQRNNQILQLLVDKGANWTWRNKFEYTVLHIAASMGNLYALQLFVKMGCDVNAREDSGHSPLHYVVSCFTSEERLLAAMFLVENGADLHAQNKDGQTILHCELTKTTSNDNDYNKLISWIADSGYESLLRERDQSQRSPLHIAVRDIELSDATLDLLLKFNHINDVDKHGSNVLFYAVAGNRSQKFLGHIVEKGADWRKTNSLGQGVLHWAARKGRINAIRFFVEKQAGVNARDLNGDTPLHCAMEQEHETTHEIVAELLAAGANPNATNAKRRTPLDVAMETKMSSKVIELLKPFETLEDNLYQATALGDLCKIRELIKMGHDVNHPSVGGETPLHRVFSGKASENLMEILQLFVENKGNLDALDDNSRTPLHCAVTECKSKDWPKAVKYLVENGADIHARNSAGQSLMHLVATSRNQDEFSGMVHWLVDVGKEAVLRDVCDHGSTPLHEGVFKFELERNVLEMLTSHVDINSLDKDGDGVLVYAVQGGRSSQFLEMLIGKGADWKWRNYSGDTMLHVASRFWNVEALRLFVGLGLDVNATSDDKSTPLHSSLRELSGNVHELVETLLQKNADVNAEDENGRTPLDLAVAVSTQQNLGQIEPRTIELLRGFRDSNLSTE